MTPEQKKIIQETWQLVIPNAGAAAKLFYDRLFEIDPTTRPLFKMQNLAEQRRKLIQLLTVAIAGLDRLEALLPAVADLGRRHAGYGVTAEHYGSVGKALLWTLEQGLGAAWTIDAKMAWSDLYSLLSGHMQLAGASRRAHEFIA